MAFLSFIPMQSDFYLILLGYTVSFLAYGYIIVNREQLFNFKLLFGIGLVIRLFLLFSEPRLSEDIYRFIWDGMMIHSGHNPYGVLPEQWITSHSGDLFQRLYDSMNSQRYYTVYPPLSQYLFAIAAVFKPLAIQIFVFKLFILLSEILLFKLLVEILKKNQISCSNVFIYFLNPLIIIEGIGNAHFELICISLFVCGLYALKERKWVLSGVLTAFSIATKLLPLMFLPIFIRYFKSRTRLLTFYFVVLITGLMLSVPFALDLNLINIFKSLDLYFQKFEFNASLYFLVRELGRWVTGYNQIWIIGPLLSIVAVILMLVRLKKSRVEDMIEFFNMATVFFIIYLISATTVHPWYLSFPIVLTVLNPRVYILIWSYTVVFSYALYQNYDYTFYYIWVSFSYVLVLLAYISEKRNWLRVK